MMKLAENVMHFARVLRRAGLKVGPASMLDATAAAAAIDVFQRDELYWALHAVLVRRPEDHDLYDQAFRLFWRDPFGAQQAMALLLPHTKTMRSPGVSRRVSEALAGGQEPRASETERVDVDAALTWGADEVLRTRDFDEMSAEELRRARAVVASMELIVRPVRTRRGEPAQRGRIDVARSLRESLRSGAGTLRFRRPARRPPPLVALCDISGSMGRYSELLLHFLHALSAHRGRVSTFLFATRLSNVTRALRRRDVDAALARCGREVRDWAGGTRLRACLAEFNRAWSRRVLGQGAVVLLITDGLDRDPEEGLAAEAERLHKSCRRLIWLNPLLRFAGFEPRALGVKALLPHVDEHRPVHNLESLESLARSLRARS
jgi:uncharacterized protein with von Willebrand factor type A (vWA) domain